MKQRSCHPLGRRVEGVQCTCSSINPPRPIDRSDRIRAAASNNRARSTFAMLAAWDDSILCLYTCVPSMDRSFFHVSHPRHKAIDVLFQPRFTTHLFVILPLYSTKDRLLVNLYRM